jgi:hypothetical protein
MLFRHDVSIMGRHIRIETDSPAVRRRIEATFQGIETATAPGIPQFAWRIAAERREGATPAWPSLNAFCHGSLHYISFGPYGFAAVDLRLREAVGVLATGDSGGAP